MIFIHLTFYFILFCIIYDRLTRKFLNPYKLIMVFGKKGSGKTTFLTKVAINEIKNNKTVYSTIDIPGTRKFDVNDLGLSIFPINSVILIDEVGMIWDNRDFKNFKTHVRDYFKFQRQYKNKVYLFSQTFDVDLKLRNLTDEMYLLTNKFRVFSVARRINKNITIQKAEEGTGRASQLVDNYEFVPLLSPNSIIITFIPRWIPYFNSYDPPRKPFIDYYRLDLSSQQERYLKARYVYFDYFVSFLINQVKPKFFKFLKKFRCRRGRERKRQ